MTGPATPARTGGRLADPAVAVVALAVVAVSVGPVVYGALNGFRSNEQIASDPAGLPSPWRLDNYTTVLTNPDFWRYAANSMVVAALTTLVAVGAGVMAAYPLARYRFRLREPLFMVFVLGLLFPLATAIIPLFVLITRDLQLSNTWWGVALPQAAFALPVTVVILRPFLMALPRELEEAALIDGASRLGVFWRIALPLSLPALITVGVLAFVGSWNSYLLPLLLLQGEMRTLPLGVADYSTQYSADTAGVLAFTTVATLPALILFLALQGRIVNGLQGAVKG
ncbi:raffinose/stachyose/melibiose transport system permease protein [Nocardioides cavernae]|uniref:Raffinose/stachyose/melibiose transport system permease protein n=1 Tax=Nocardioides cavernae TaxID=1921566 RepID=A0A7Y9H1M9_9ACTN|nr:raffinose/stachyose/melibiose transport system permease protein [Nocardioides cavernae]